MQSENADVRWVKEMTEAFEEFLKKKTSDISLELATIKVTDLGEWALGYVCDSSAFLFDLKNYKRFEDLRNDWKMTLAWKISEACLGKEEIEKRLKEIEELRMEKKEGK